jgi:hypothetical protein
VRVLGPSSKILAVAETESDQKKIPISLNLIAFLSASRRPGDRARLTGGGYSHQLTRLADISLTHGKIQGNISR